MEPPTFEIEVPTLVAVKSWVGAHRQVLKRLITEDETKPKKADAEGGAAQPIKDLSKDVGGQRILKARESNTSQTSTTRRTASTASKAAVKHLLK